MHQQLQVGGTAEELLHEQRVPLQALLCRPFLLGGTAGLLLHMLFEQQVPPQALLDCANVAGSVWE